MPLIQISQTGKKTRPLIWIWGQEDTPLIWDTPSAGSLYKDMEDGSFCCSLFAYPCCLIKFIPPLALDCKSL